MMGRSCTLNGATVALELLRRQIDCAPGQPLTITLQGASLGSPATHEQAQSTLSAASLHRSDIKLPIGPFAAHVNLAAALATPVGPDALLDLMSGNLRYFAGHLLLSLLAGPTVAPGTIYQLSLTFAVLTRSDEALSLLALVDWMDCPNPAILALRGYHAFQKGDTDMGANRWRAPLAGRHICAVS